MIQYSTRQSGTSSVHCRYRFVLFIIQIFLFINDYFFHFPLLTSHCRYIQPLLKVLEVKESKSKQTQPMQPFPIGTSKRNYSKTLLSPYRQSQITPTLSLISSSSSSISSKYNKNNYQLIDPKDDSFILLVDFKSNPNIAAELLNQVIQPLKPYLSKVKNGKFYKGSVTILVSGNRPSEDSLYVNAVNNVDYIDGNHNDTGIKKIASNRFLTQNYRGGESTNPNQKLEQHRLTEKIFEHIFLGKSQLCGWTEDMKVSKHKKGLERYLFIDGRIKDLHREESTILIPLISLNWSTVRLHRLFGKGDEYMKRYADLAHSQGKKLRIWGAPNTESVWRSMMRNDIDWLSIDDHARFAKFASKES